MHVVRYVFKMLACVAHDVITGPKDFVTGASQSTYALVSRSQMTSQLLLARVTKALVERCLSQVDPMLSQVVASGSTIQSRASEQDVADLQAALDEIFACYG